MSRWGRIFAVCLLGFASGGVAAERTWTSLDGRTMQAEFVRELDGEVTFLQGGKLVTIPLARLSPADQQIVRDLAAGKAVPGDAPAVDSAAAAEDAPDAGLASDGPSSLTRRKPPTISNRIWTDKSGRQTSAKFIRVFGDNVILSRAGKALSVPYFDLSGEDQEYVRELLTAQGKESLIPEPPPEPATETGDADSPPAGSSTDDSTSEETVSGPGFPPAGVSVPSGIPVPSGFPVPAGIPVPSSPASNGSSPFPRSAPSFPRSPMAGPGSSFAEQARQRHEEFLQRVREQQEQRQQARLDAMQQAQQERSDSRQANQLTSPQEPPRFAQNEIVGECLACKGKLTQAQSELGRCPHCNVAWQYEVDDWGRKKQIASAETATSFGARSGGPNQVAVDPAVKAKAVRIGIIAGVVIAILAMIAVVIFVAVVIASASSAGKQRRYS